MNNSKSKIGSQIKKFRVRRGMTQQDLAEKIGLSEKQISKIETGIHYPKFENFVKIMDVLGVSMKDFDYETESESNTIRDNIIKILYKENETELKHYLVMIKSLEKIFKENKK